MRFTKREIKELKELLKLPKVKKALSASIKHWEKDIVKRLREGDSISMSICWRSDGERVNCYADSCPLCQLFNDQCSLFKKQVFYYCPLVVIHESCEESSNSPWRRFTNIPTLQRAKAMVNVLKKILEVGNA